MANGPPGAALVVAVLFGRASVPELDATSLATAATGATVSGVVAGAALAAGSLLELETAAGVAVDVAETAWLVEGTDGCFTAIVCFFTFDAVLAFCGWGQTKTQHSGQEQPTMQRQNKKGKHAGVCAIVK